MPGSSMVQPFVLPQFGIFAQGTHAHHFLEFDLRPGVTPAEAVDAFRRLRTPDVSAGGVTLFVPFGSDAWRAVSPAGLRTTSIASRASAAARATEHRQCS